MALMKLDARKPLTPLLIGLLLVLLPLLAVLQYRWLTEVSAGEKMQMRAHLRSAAEEFTSGFDRELTRAFLLFQPDQPPSGPVSTTALAAVTARNWRVWQTTAPAPQLVESIDLVQVDASGAWTLERFSPQTSRFSPIAWPPKLAAWRGRLRQAWQRAGERPPLFMMLGASDNAAIPAMPILLPGPRPRPPFRALPPPPGRRLRNGGWGFPQRLLLVQLNEDWLRQTFLPQLARHAFAPAGVSEYHLVIHDTANPQRILFEWGPSPEASAAKAPPDWSAPMFRIRMADFVAVWARPGASAGAGPAVRRRPFLRDLRESRRVFRVQGVPSRGDRRFPVFFGNGRPGFWVLQIRHQAGSLTAAVARIRRRNLGVSGGILVLLLVSILLLYRLMRDAQRLAGQQMEFVAGVSHELRTPLAVIGSAASNLADGVVSEAGQVRKYGTLIAAESRRLNGMVEQILEFSALQVRRQPLQTQAVGLPALIAAVTHAAEPGLTEKGIELECELPDSLPLVEADPAALRRCLENLVGNATKYAAEGKWIGIRATVDGDEVSITVEDRGPGIEARDLPHLFEPFYRGRRALERQIHGNGLGLSLVERLMRAQNGRVTVRTQPGQGSAFTLHLRVAAPPQPAAGRVPSQA